MRLILCHDVKLGYEGKTVVEDLGMEVHAGDYLCIVGENGSGKSTFMRALLGLKKPLDGHICFENGLTRRQIGYMPQQTAVGSDFPATVKEVVQSGLRGGLFRPFYTRAEKEKLERAFQLLEIEDIKDAAYKSLSGGQQQRVLLARAMCATDKLLLLDEPVAGLDPAMTASLYATIKKLHESGVTIVMISHDIPAAVKYATHILHLRRRPLFFGTAADYAASEAGKRFLEGGDAQ